MNNLSQCIFDISHVNKNLRDTLGFILPNEVDLQTFEARKTVVRAVLDEKTFVGRFVNDNIDKLKDFKENYNSFFNDVYGDESTILTKTAEGKIRVDHAQHIIIFRGVIYLGETIRDIMFTHLTRARQEHTNEQNIDHYVDMDERFDRAIKTYLLLQEYQKSFMEFQKVMNESQGKPTPQSNYIVQNELNVLAGMMRFTRQHCHFIDNRSLDIYDRVVQLIEMCEGKRERRDNKNFQDLFALSLKEVGDLSNEFSASYNDSYRLNLQEMVEQIKKNKDNTEA